MSNDRTRLITIRLDPRAPTAKAQGEDDLAAVLRWLGEASAAGWRVSAHIPHARMALVVSSVMDDSSDDDSSDSEAASDGLETSSSGVDDGSDSDEEDSLSVDEESVLLTGPPTSQPIACAVPSVPSVPSASAVRPAPSALPRPSEDSGGSAFGVSGQQAPARAPGRGGSGGSSGSLCAPRWSHQRAQALANCRPTTLPPRLPVACSPSWASSARNSTTTVS